MLLRVKGKRMQHFNFSRTEDGVREMAIFVATLIKEGVGFSIAQDRHGFEISLTGGF